MIDTIKIKGKNKKIVVNPYIGGIYEINVTVGGNNLKDTKGLYLTKEHTKGNPHIVICDINSSTIMHESTHAALDIYRDVEIDFNDVFYNFETGYEEQFCHLVQDIYEEIICFIKELGLKCSLK